MSVLENVFFHCVNLFTRKFNRSQIRHKKGVNHRELRNYISKNPQTCPLPSQVTVSHGCTFTEPGMRKQNYVPGNEDCSVSRFARSLAHQGDVGAFPLPVQLLNCPNQAPLSVCHCSREATLETTILQNYQFNVVQKIHLCPCTLSNELPYATLFHCSIRCGFNSSPLHLHI